MCSGHSIKSVNSKAGKTRRIIIVWPPSLKSLFKQVVVRGLTGCEKRLLLRIPEVLLKQVRNTVGTLGLARRFSNRSESRYLAWLD